jgi:AcrR family transcriptional regulator
MRADATTNRALLIRTAQRLFAERGTTSVAYSAVAHAAGVGIGTLYRHFPRPDDLVAAAVVDGADRVEDLCAQHRESLRRAPEEGWGAFVDDLVAADVASFLPSVVIDSGDALGALERVRDKATDAVGDLLAVAKAAGLVPSDLDTVQFLVGIVVLSRPLPEPGPAHVEGLRGWLGSVYVDGLRRQASTAAHNV